MEEKKKFNWPKFFIISGVLLAVFLVAGAGFYLVDKNKRASQENNSNVVATVGDQKITTDDLNKFTYAIVLKGTPQNPDLTDSGITKEIALDELVEATILKKEAPGLGVKYTEEDVKKFILVSYPTYDFSDPAYKQVYDYQEYLYLKGAVSAAVTGTREGKFVFARDDIYYPDPSKTVTSQDQAKIDQNIAYSKKFIEDIYSKLKGKTISFDQAMQLELKDSFIGENVPSENGVIHSGTFDSDDYADRSSILGYDAALQEISKLKINEMTKPIHLFAESADNKKISVGWVIATLTNTDNEGGGTYDDWYQKKMKQYNVTTKEV